MTWLSLTRELYNAALRERRDAWNKQRVRVSPYDQQRQLPDVRETRPEFNEIPIVVLRGVIRRLDRAFRGFFRRCKTGDKPGYPRFKSADRFDSLLIDDMKTSKGIVCGGKRIAVPLLGKVKVKLHRPLEGTPKAMRLKRDHVGRWWVTFACVDVPEKPLPKTGETTGIDLGLHHFVATSEGKTFPNERPGSKARILVERAQRRVTRRKRGSNRRRQAVCWLAKTHARVANQRREWHIAIAKWLVAGYDTIFVENLNVKGLTRGFLSKSFHDAALGSFLWWLTVKAEEAAREVPEVNCRGSSQECPDCAAVAPKTLSQRVHRCPCGCVEDRDVAAAKVIKGRGLRLRGAASLVGERQRSAKPKSEVSYACGES